MRRVLRSARDKLVDVRPEEIRAVAFAFVFNFVVLASYYVVRPIRDEIGAAGGLDTLSWMYSGTLVTMLAANVLFSKLVAHFSRRRFIPLAYRFFIGNLILFYFAMRCLSATQQVWVGRAFFVWVSVFNLFVVTVFWAFMTDVFNTEQAKRLFGFISVGGTLGAILGAVITAALVQYVGTMNLLFASALLLEVAAQCVRHFPFGFRRHRPGESDRAARDEAPIGGGIWTGMTHAIRSPYLLGMCGFLLLYTITSTVMYFQQADITAHHFHDRAARTAFFAQLDLSVNVLTVLIQIFLTGRLLKHLGVGVTLALLPAISTIGFVAVACAPGLGLVAISQTLRRASNFALSRPAREVLFTVLTREDKYKAKGFIDTFVYRAGDQIGAWSYPALTWLGLGITGISWLAVPLAGVWFILSLWLGRRQVELAPHPGRS
ncbi:MAG: MFS transporter [Verrucomicrobiota bacterium]|nr:MFS transporter [Verrucomicrobiota bacterium]